MGQLIVWNLLGLVRLRWYKRATKLPISTPTWTASSGVSWLVAISRSQCTRVSRSKLQTYMTSRILFARIWWPARAQHIIKQLEIFNIDIPMVNTSQFICSFIWYYLVNISWLRILVNSTKWHSHCWFINIIWSALVSWYEQVNLNFVFYPY